MSDFAIVNEVENQATPNSTDIVLTEQNIKTVAELQTLVFRSPVSWEFRYPKWFCLSNAELGWSMVKHLMNGWALFLKHTNA